MLDSSAYEAISGAFAPAGQVLVSLVDGCHSKLEYLDPGDGRVVRSRRVADSVNSIALSPDGQYLAYMTYPACAKPGGLPDHGCSQCAQFGPNVLVILDLQTGTTVRTASPLGRPIDELSWNPDGRQLLATYTAYYPQLMILDPGRPDYVTAERIRAPRNCGYYSGSWTTDGIVAAETCRTGPPFSPAHVVRLTPTGGQIRSWALPSCIDGFTTETGATGSTVFAGAFVGYGNGRCASTEADGGLRVFAVGRRAVRTVLEASNGLSLPE